MKEKRGKRARIRNRSERQKTQRQEMVVGTLALLWYRVFLNEAGYTAIRCVLPRRFFLNANGPTHGRTDGRTDRPSYRDARTHLKRGDQTELER